MLTLAEHEAKMKIREDLIKELEIERDELLEACREVVRANKTGLMGLPVHINRILSEAIAKAEGK
jgi:hypothetical protein